MSRDNHILHAYKQTGELADTMSHHRWCSPDPSLFYLTLRSFVFNHTESLLTTSVSNQHLITLINQIPMDPGGPLYICSHWVQECVAMRESGNDRVSRPLIVIFLIKLMDVQFDFFFLSVWDVDPDHPGEYFQTFWLTQLFFQREKKEIKLNSTYSQTWDFTD